MDNFRHNKKRSAHSIDGFVKPHVFSAKKPANNPGDLQAFNTYYKGNAAQEAVDKDAFRISRIDDFRQIDGFQPASQAPISDPGAMNKPAELGEIYTADNEEPKARRFGRKSKQKSVKNRRSGFMHFRRKQKEPKGHDKHHKLKNSLRIAGVLAVLVVFMAGALGLKTFLKTKGILKGGSNGALALNKNVDPTLLKGEGDGRVNILLLGKGGAGHDGPDLTDTILIASIDPIAKEIALLSLPRDLWVKSPVGGQSKINAVYANAKYGVLNNYSIKQQNADVKAEAEKAGIKAIEKTVTTVLGIPIQYFGMVDFQGFAAAINAVGGIDINVKTEVYDTFIKADNNNNPLIAAVGQQHFDGKHALLYAQSRHGSLRGDFDRTERQREVIVSLKDKILSLGTFANPLKVNQLIDAIGDHVATDFSTNELKRVYDIVKEIPTTKIASIGLADPPNNFVTTDTINSQSVVVPRAGEFVYGDIQSYVRNTLRDSFLKSENASIIILNGTNTPGLATLKSTELKSYGYSVTQVADAPTKTYTKTMLVDLRKGAKKYTKNYLEKRLGVMAVSELPDTAITPGTADFVIILGSNESSASL